MSTLLATLPRRLFVQRGPTAILVGLTTRFARNVTQGRHRRPQSVRTSGAFGKAPEFFLPCLWPGAYSLMLEADRSNSATTVVLPPSAAPAAGTRTFDGERDGIVWAPGALQ